MTGDHQTRIVLSRTEGAVRWLTFNRAEKRNALSLEMSVKALEIIAAFAVDPALRVLVVCGAGDKAFVSGADISEFEKERNDAASSARYGEITTAMFNALYTVEKPTIAMIKGYCLGGGLALAASCDLRFVSHDAQFAVPAARIGLAYRPEFTRRLIDLIGPARTKEILYTGRRFDAREALEIGFANRVLPKRELETQVRDCAQLIAGNAPLSVKSSKAIVNQLLMDEGARDPAHIQRLIDACANSEDFAEGRRAFMEKRPPRFTGR